MPRSERYIRIIERGLNITLKTVPEKGLAFSELEQPETPIRPLQEFLLAHPRLLPAFETVGLSGSMEEEKLPSDDPEVRGIDREGAAQGETVRAELGVARKVAIRRRPKEDLLPDRGEEVGPSFVPDTELRRAALGTTDREIRDGTVTEDGRLPVRRPLGGLQRDGTRRTAETEQKCQEAPLA